MALGECFERLERAEGRVAHPLHACALEAVHLGARGRQCHAIDIRREEALAMSCHVSALVNLDEDDVAACLGVERVAAQVVVLILPKAEVEYQSLGQLAVQQARRQVRLGAQREILTERPLACDDARRARVRLRCRIARCIALPLRPQVLTVASGRLHRRQAVARVRRVRE